MNLRQPRTTRACDQCRKLKMKCEPLKQSTNTCVRCVKSGIQCTHAGASHKRGPPKGYMASLERRLQCAEGLLGVLISSSDPRATSLLADLSEDSLAKSILARIAAQNNAQPPTRRNVRADNEDKAPSIDEKGHLSFSAPSKTWQLYLNFRLAAEPRALPQEPCQEQSDTTATSFQSSEAGDIHMATTENVKSEYFDDRSVGSILEDPDKNNSQSGCFKPSATADAHAIPTVTLPPEVDFTSVVCDEESFDQFFAVLGLEKTSLANSRASDWIWTYPDSPVCRPR